MTELEPSPLLVQQRVRNRLIEWLEMVVDFELDHPPFDLGEVLNQWEDWVQTEADSNVPEFPAPVYSVEEATLLVAVHSSWDRFCAATPQMLTWSNEVQALQQVEWRDLVSVAQSALLVLKIRGRFSEEFEREFAQC